MNKELCRAKREDKKDIKDTDQDELHEKMGQYMGGEGENNQSEVHTKAVSALWINKIREKFRGAVIRRTVNSLDYTGKPISGLEPYKEHLSVINMYEHEYEALEALAEKAMDSETFVRRFASEVSKTQSSVSLYEQTNQALGDTEFLFRHSENLAPSVVCRHGGERDQNLGDVPGGTLCKAGLTSGDSTASLGLRRRPRNRAETSISTSSNCFPALRTTATAISSSPTSSRQPDAYSTR